MTGKISGQSVLFEVIRSLHGLLSAFQPTFVLLTFMSPLLQFESDLAAFVCRLQLVPYRDGDPLWAFDSCRIRRTVIASEKKTLSSFLQINCGNSVRYSRGFVAFGLLH